jgi:hypothetical protein
MSIRRLIEDRPLRPGPVLCCKLNCLSSAKWYECYHINELRRKNSEKSDINWPKNHGQAKGGAVAQPPPLNTPLLATYPTISAMLQIFATLPVTTATGGKSFSALKYLKNYLRSIMTEDRLGLAHLYINRDIELARSLKSLERVTDA